MNIGIKISPVWHGASDGRELVPAKRVEYSHSDARECEWWRLDSSQADSPGVSLVRPMAWKQFQDHCDGLERLGRLDRGTRRAA